MIATYCCAVFGGEGNMIVTCCQCRGKGKWGPPRNFTWGPPYAIGLLLWIAV